MADEEKTNYIDEFKTMLEEHTWSGHAVAPKHIVDREEAHDYIATHKLKVIYQSELNDGTPRRLWLLTDSGGHTCGRLYTGRGDLGRRNKEQFHKDIFDFMEINVPRGTYKKGEKNIAG